MAPTFWVPFAGDQALFATAGAQMADGAAYYRDFWDIKQPGIFVWYGLAHLLPGSDLVGVRTLDLIWTTATAVMVSLLARGTTDRPTLRVLAPVVVLAAYPATARAIGLAQVETLVGLPLCAVLVLGRRGTRLAHEGRRSAPWLVGAGIAGGVAVVLKITFALPVAVLFVAVALGRDPANHSDALDVAPRRRALSLGTRLGWLAGGAALPVAAVIAEAAAHGALDILVPSTLVEPLRIAALPTLRDANMYPQLGAQAFATYSLTGALAIVGLVAGRHERRTWLYLAWAAAATLMIAVQRPSPYQVFAVLIPVGLLAVRGVVATADWTAGLRTRPVGVRRQALVAGSLAAVILAAPLAGIGGMAPAVATVHAHGSPFTASGSKHVAEHLSVRYRKVQRAAAELPPAVTAPPDPIYVLGDPLWYQQLDRRQAIELNGWFLELMTPRVWAELNRQIHRSRPRAVFVDEFSRPYLTRHAPDIVKLLTDTTLGYEAVHHRAGDANDPGAGTWYVTTQTGPSTPTTDGNQLYRRDRTVSW